MQFSFEKSKSDIEKAEKAYNAVIKAQEATLHSLDQIEKELDLLTGESDVDFDGQQRQQ